MLQGIARGLRAARNGLTHVRHFSEAKPPGPVTSRLAALEEETASGHKLFQNVSLPEGAGAAAATAARVGTAGAGAGAGAAAAGPEALGTHPLLNAAGNAVFFGGVAAASFFGYYYWRYEVDELEALVESTSRPENAFPGSGAWAAVMGWYVERRRALEGEVKKYADPPSDKLLPDLPPAARHIKTLVLDLDHLLVHSHWTRERGWRCYKRPGAEEFIAGMAQYYELVVYTDKLCTYVDPILDRLDPQRLIQYRLYRDSNQWENNEHVRDLTKLNRDLAQVLFLTADPEARFNPPENGIRLKPWRKEPGDTGLVDMLPFLEAVVATHVPDVRRTVAAYAEEEDIPQAFKARMAAVTEQRAQRQGVGRGLLSGLAGGR
ncbi:TIM50 [Auxenochlorella protothecoides x Auxenochlorella symbiontica]